MIAWLLGEEQDISQSDYKADIQMLANSASVECSNKALSPVEPNYETSSEGSQSDTGRRSTRAAEVQRSQRCLADKILFNWSANAAFLFFASDGAFKLEDHIGHRRVPYNYSHIEDSEKICDALGRLSVVVTLHSDRASHLKALQRSFQETANADKEMVVIDTHWAAPNQILLSMARAEERFVYVPVPTKHTPVPEFGLIAGTCLASGQYVIHATIEELMENEVGKPPITMTKPYRLRSQTLAQHL